jgi:hypothetical protein
MHCSLKARPLLAGVALSILASPAFALDGNDVLAKINKALEIQGASINAQSVAVAGETVTLTGTSVSASGTTESFPVGTVTLQGVTETSGAYRIDKVTFPNVNTSKEGSTVSISDISISGLAVPADASTGGFDSLLVYDEAHAGPMSVAVDGKTIFSVAEANVTTSLAEDDSGLDFDLSLKDLTADLSVVEDPKSRETLADLGLTSLNGKVLVSGNWTQNDGTIDVKEYSVDLDKVGRLNLAFSLSGYTLDFIRSAQETAKAMSENPDKQEAQQAANLAMLGLMQRLTFNSAQVRFEDDGITQRALAYAGKTQGTTGEQMAQMVKAMTPIVLSQYNIPELQNMLSTAVNAFLDKPGTLTVDAVPANPVPFPMILGAAMGAPNTLPKVLGVKVSAND